MGNQDTEKHDVTLTLFLTESCNLNCIYCYEHAKSKQVMEFDTATQWITRCLSRMDNTHVNIYLFGGEPFLVFPLMQRICEWTWSKEWRIPYKFSVQTNGTLLTREIKDWCAAHREHISLALSLDGGKRTHDLNRSNSFDRIDLDYFLTNWPDQPVKMTISQDNLDHICEDIIFIQNRGFKVREANIAVEEKEWNSEKRMKFARQLSKLVDFYTEHPSYDIAPIIDIPLSLCESHPGKRSNCNIGTDRMIVISTDGSYSPCSFFSRTSLGSEKLSKIKSLINDIKGKELPCAKRCYLYPVCQICLGENYYATGDPLKPSEAQCDITKLRVAAAVALQAKRLSDKNNDLITANDIFAIKAINNIVDKYKSYFYETD